MVLLQEVEKVKRAHLTIACLLSASFSVSHFHFGAGPFDNCMLVICIAYVLAADPCDNCMFLICITLLFFWGRPI